MGPHDLVAVVTSSGRADMGQNFTNNQRCCQCDQQIHRPQGGIARHSNASFSSSTGRLTGAHDPQNTHLWAAELPGIGCAAGARDGVQLDGGLKGMTKSLILVSEGLDYDYESIRSRTLAAEVLAEQREAIASATRANVTVYPIDPGGLGQDDSIVVSGFSRGADPTAPQTAAAPSFVRDDRRTRACAKSLRIRAASKRPHQ
jgi:hypothetical protein